MGLGTPKLREGTDVGTTPKTTLVLTRRLKTREVDCLLPCQRRSEIPSISGGLGKKQVYGSL